jgi:peptidoglycan-associated lipoprotein
MSRTALALAVAVALVAGPGCKKKPPPPVTPERPQPVEVRLQVTSIAPSTVAPSTPTPAKLYGSAFEDGASVIFVGPQKGIGQEVRVESGNTISVTIPSLQEGTYDVMVQNAAGEQSTLRGGLTVRTMDLSCRTATVNFDFDRSTIRNDAKSVLDANMSCYQKASGAVRIEGHCDERGTVDYNLALGQRRADTVKQYLVSGGVSASRLTTTSYGEERPVDRGHDENAWARNRRAEILVSE